MLGAVNYSTGEREGFKVKTQSERHRAPKHAQTPFMNSREKRARA